RAREHGALLSRPAGPRRISRVLPPPAGSGRSDLVSGRRHRAVDLHDRPGPDLVGADGALPRYPGSAVKPPDALVFRDANHLPVDAGERAAVQVDLQREPIYASRDLVSGNPFLQGSHWPLEMAARARRRIGGAVPGGLLVVRSPARFVCRGGVIRDLPRSAS